ncbi:MAG: ISAs1 family transposase [Planctomycetaceae bacterium]
MIGLLTSRRCARLSAFATDTRLVLGGNCRWMRSRNEILAVPVLPEAARTAGAIVTLDAMHTQVETARAIVKSQADYVMTVKQNQPQLHQRLSELFEQVTHSKTTRCRGSASRSASSSCSHGRIEQRSCYVIDVPKGDKVLSRWPSLRSIGLLYRHSTSTDKQGETKESHDVAFFIIIISLPPCVRRLNQPLRDHWSIENSEHYVLDVVLTEDASRIRTGLSAPEVAAAFRRLSLNILQQDRSLKENIRGKRLRAGWDEAALDGIDTAFQAA